MSGVLQLPAGVALRLLAARFLGWWTGELRTLVPPGLARRLTAPVGGERRLRIPADGALPAAHGLPRGTAVTLELDPALVFEAVLDLPDVDLTEWLTGREPIPADICSPMLERMREQCGQAGAGIPKDLRLP